MLVAGPQRGLFLSCLGVGVVCLLLLDVWLGPTAIAEGDTPLVPTGTVADPAAVVAKNASSAVDPPAASTVRVVLDPAARVPTIVARFDSEAKEPADDVAIRALARAMIEDHSVKIVLEGHSDTRGGGDFNHEISLRRADFVKSRLVELGVSEDRIETVGLGATRPLRSDEPDAQSVNRRVEVRWVGR